jgi:hypothetical protein
MGWSAFWGTCSQTHLVTLPEILIAVSASSRSVKNTISHLCFVEASRILGSAWRDSKPRPSVRVSRATARRPRCRLSRQIVFTVLPSHCWVRKVSEVRGNYRSPSGPIHASQNVFLLFRDFVSSRFLWPYFMRNYWPSYQEGSSRRRKKIQITTVLKLDYFLIRRIHMGDGKVHVWCVARFILAQYTYQNGG